MCPKNRSENLLPLIWWFYWSILNSLMMLLTFHINALKWLRNFNFWFLSFFWNTGLEKYNFHLVPYLKRISSIDQEHLIFIPQKVIQLSILLFCKRSAVHLRTWDWNLIKFWSHMNLYQFCLRNPILQSFSIWKPKLGLYLDLLNTELHQTHA